MWTKGNGIVILDICGPKEWIDNKKRWPQEQEELHDQRDKMLPYPKLSISKRG